MESDCIAFTTHAFTFQDGFSGVMAIGGARKFAKNGIRRDVSTALLIYLSQLNESTFGSIKASVLLALCCLIYRLSQAQQCRSPSQDYTDADANTAGAKGKVSSISLFYRL